jgi:hypothetical protein
VDRLIRRTIARMRFPATAACTMLLLTGCAAVQPGSKPADPAGAGPRTAAVLQGERGDLVALVFISHECPIANAMVPDILDLADEAKALGIRAYAVHSAHWVDDATIARHAREFGLDGRITVIADRPQALAHAVGATVTPEGAVLRLDGSGGFDRLYLGRVNDLYAAIGRRRAQPTAHDLRDAMRAARAGGTTAEPAAKPIGCFIEFAATPGGGA